MKTLIWLWVTAASLSLGICQNREIDSLQNSLDDLTVEDDFQLANVNARIGWLFFNESKPDSAILYYKRALTMHHQNADQAWLGNLKYGLAASYAAIGHSDSSITYYREALKSFAVVGDDDNVASINSNLSVTYRNLGLYEEAFEAAGSAAKIFEGKAPSLNLAIAYHSMGQILTKLEDYERAKRYYRNAISLFEKFNEAYLARSYNNLGEIYILTQQYDSAHINLEVALLIKRRLNDLQGFTQSSTRLGKVMTLEGNLVEAEQQLNESLLTQAKLDDPVGMIEVLNNLGELYLITKRYSQAHQALTKAEEIIRKTGTPDYLRQNLELQIKLAHARNDFAKGMILLDELIVVKDSLMNEEKTRSIQAMQIRYDTEKKEQQIALLHHREEINQARISNNQIVIGSLAAGLLLVGALGLLIYVNFRNTRTSKKKIELLLAETRHRTKNNFQTLASIFHMQTRNYTDQQMILEARSSESRVHTMSLLHDKFYHSEPGHTIRGQSFMTDLVRMLVDIYGAQTGNLKLSVQVDDIDLDIDKALALSIIIHELVCNAFKHAFDHQPHPMLTVRISSHGEDVTAIVSDNGIGIDLKSDSSSTSQGFDLVEAFVSQLDGTLKVSNDHGTTFTIQFPLTPLWKRRLFS